VNLNDHSKRLKKLKGETMGKKVYERQIHHEPKETCEQTVAGYKRRMLGQPRKERLRLVDLATRRFNLTNSDINELREFACRPAGE